ncbi:MAG TPA: tRNA (adenosine(37)-N6)-threonylcarbamoyltransferase complex dimerization subunit type 1 TsaB, partial [Dehalococcoidia bacterium]|nr:tRNA (adenosine(37)-N6)-threonylcarbamoyltransferase complex dimerization subunit type 1 TsaB [Dehalococcoidia bacterium]
YMGVRVAMATAKGLALALGLPIVGVNRLSLDAWPHRAYAGPIVAVHKAGRRQWAWAAYAWDPPAWRELQAPRLDDAESLADAAPAGLLLCGEPDEELCAAVRPPRVVRGESAARRPAGLCELGWLALQERGADDLAGLAPIYLREPAIGPQQEVG